MLQPLLLLAALAPQNTWSALPLPRLCEESFIGAQMPRLQPGQHMLLAGQTKHSARSTRVRLTAADLGSLLMQSARGGERNLRILPYSPPLYAQASAQDLDWARKALEAIDLAAARQELQVSVWLIPGGIGAPAPGDGDLPEGTQHWQKSLNSGSGVSFGERQQQAFVASYDVEVASQAGVAAPLTGQISTGSSLHLALSRVDGGRRYHLRGQLDLSELTSLTGFDPQTPDLGQFSQPLVTSVDLAFSAVGKLGSYQSVEIEGSPLKVRDWKLWIRVQGQPEPTGARAANVAAGHDWRAIDVSLLEARPPEFGALSPGAGLSASAQLEASLPAAAPITASGVLAAIQGSGRSSRSSVGRTADGGREAMQICEGLILVATGQDDRGLTHQIEQFVAAAEAPRLVTALVEIESGDLRVRFPSALGELARLWVGSERTLVTGYNSEIAPNTWMPAPKVEFALDGLAWQGRLGARHLETEAFLAQTDELLLQGRDEVQMGAIQLPKRSIRSAQRAVRPDGSRQALWPSNGKSRALTVQAGLVP